MKQSYTVPKVQIIHLSSDQSLMVGSPNVDNHYDPSGAEEQFSAEREFTNDCWENEE